MKRFYKKKGFTLLELMIVVIIIGILASLALPRFIDATRKAREAEARSILGSIRSAQFRYYLEWNMYTPWIDRLDINLINPSKYYGYASELGDAGYIGDAQALGGHGLRSFRIQVDGTIYSY